MKIEELFDGKFEEKLEEKIKETANKFGIDYEVDDNNKIVSLSKEINLDVYAANEYVQEEVIKNYELLNNPETLRNFIDDLSDQFNIWAGDEGDYFRDRLRGEVLDYFEDEIANHYGDKMTYSEVQDFVGEISDMLYDNDNYVIEFSYDYDPGKDYVNIPLIAYTDMEDYAVNFCNCSIEEIAKDETIKGNTFACAGLNDYAENLVFIFEGSLEEFLEIQENREQYCMVFHPEERVFLEYFSWSNEVSPEKEMAISFENIEAGPFAKWCDYDAEKLVQWYNEAKRDLICESSGTVKENKNIDKDIFLKGQISGEPTFGYKIQEKRREIESQEVNCR